MKNGLVLLLLMVALVAMTASAGAMAPVVGPLPAVIIGSSGDIAGPATAETHLLRYVNVFNLSDPGVITRRTNPDDVSKLAVWYSVLGTDSAKLKVSTSASLITAMTAAEATALTTVGTQPATTKRIKASTAANLWLSLIQDAPGVGKVSAVSAAAATVTLHGASVAELASLVGTANKKTVKLYAVDVDSVTTAVGTGQFDVYSLLSVSDGLSPRTNASSGSTEGDGLTGWVWVGPLGKAVTGSSIGFTGRNAWTTTTPGYQYSTWGRVFTPAINPSGLIYEAKATVTGSATNAVDTPGFRLFFIANFGVHSGGMQYLTGADTPGGQGQNIPKAGASKEIRIYWAAPRDLTDMGDTGLLAAYPGTPVTDKRIYGLQFDMIQQQLTDAGKNIMMTAFNLDLIPRPVNIAPARKYADGTNGSARFSPVVTVPQSGWYDNSEVIGGYGAGVCSVGESNITIGMGSSNSAYRKVSVGFAEAAILPDWLDGQLIRTTYVLQAPGTSVPAFRLNTFFFGGAYGAIMTIDNFNFDYLRSLYKPSTGPTGHSILAGTPKLAGSTVESYSYTHDAPAVPETFVYPQVDIVQRDGSGSGATANWNGWTKPGNLIINSIAIEVLKP